MVVVSKEIKEKQAKLEELKKEVEEDKVSTVQVQKHNGSMNDKFVRGGKVKEYMLTVDGHYLWLILLVFSHLIHPEYHALVLSLQYQYPLYL